MNPLIRIPHDLSYTILKEWTTSWRDISALDVAFCNRATRADFLALLGKPGLQFADLDETAEVNDLDRTLNHIGHHEDAAVEFLRWVTSRKVELRAFYLMVCQLPTVAGITGSVYPTVKKLVLMDHQFHFEHGAHGADADGDEEDEGEGEEEDDEEGWDEEEEDEHEDEEHEDSDEDAVPDLVEIGATASEDGSHHSHSSGEEDEDEDEGDAEDDDEDEDEEGDWEDFDDEVSENSLHPATVVNAADLARLLALFPGLTEIDCSEWVDLDDRHLDAVLLTNTLALRGLNLYACERITAQKAVDVIRKHGANLEELWCDVLTDACLPQINACCKGFHFLGLACDALSHESIVQFVSQYPNLEEIRLDLLDYSEDAPVSDQLVLEVTQACKKLQVVEVDVQQESITLASCQHIVKNCPEIKTIVLMGMQIEIREDGTSKDKFCDLKLSADMLQLGDAQAVVQLCWYPIHSLLAAKELEFDADILRMVADRHGASLTELQCSLDDDVSAEVVEYLLSKTPNILGLVLSHCVCVADDMVLKLLDYCPHILTFGMESPHITNDAILAVLDRYGRNKMESLMLDGCSLLTDALLPSIMDLAPELLDLGIARTAMTKEGMLDAIKLYPRFAAGVSGMSAADVQWIKDELALVHCSTKVHFIEDQGQLHHHHAMEPEVYPMFDDEEAGDDEDENDDDMPDLALLEVD